MAETLFGNSVAMAANEDAVQEFTPKKKPPSEDEKR